MSRLKDTYKNEIVDAMIKKFGYKNIMEVPKLDKIVVNMGVGEAKDNAKLLDAAVADMEVGQVVDIHLMPEEAYGMPNPEAIFTVEIAELPGSEDLEVGQQVYLSNQYGQPFPVKVTAKEETTITFDANHEMAGKELNFKIELVEIC